MAWQTPKTNWGAADVPLPDDFNRIEGNVQELQNTKETPAGAQAKANTAEANAKAYTDAHEQKAAPHSGHETPAGAQAKAEAAAGAVQADLDAHLADYVPFKDRTNMNILNLAIETEMLKGAVLTGITANIYIETFQDATDVDILQGYLIPGEGITG